MSDLMAVLVVSGEKFVCVDYDRPVWYSKVDSDLSATPSLQHFVVDGILAVASNKMLNTVGISKRFSSKDFEKDISTPELQAARKILYEASELSIEYFHDLDGDIQIHKDLTRFKAPIGRTIKLSTEDLLKFSNK